MKQKFALMPLNGCKGAERVVKGAFRRALGDLATPLSKSIIRETSTPLVKTGLIKSVPTTIYGPMLNSTRKDMWERVEERIVKGLNDTQPKSWVAVIDNNSATMNVTLRGVECELMIVNEELLLWDAYHETTTGTDAVENARLETITGTNAVELTSYLYECLGEAPEPEVTLGYAIELKSYLYECQGPDGESVFREYE